MKYKITMPDGEELFFDKKPEIYVTAKVNIKINGEDYELDFDPYNEDFDDYAVDSEIVDEEIEKLTEGRISYISGAKYSGNDIGICYTSFYFVDKTNNKVIAVNGFKEFYDTGISGYYHPVGGNPFRADEIDFVMS